ncbi:LysE family transporter [Gallaecimonas sp. GXIMD4217]|uniref:LysE family translocator n=1 Tax=Gallaecimonas sp. GXIMD4217 TaxID=3131927 RepID=UPI00311AE31F
MMELIAVATITLLAVVSPGADFAMASRNAMVLGRRAGLMTALGIALAVWIHVAYSMLGVGLIISQSIVLFSLLKYLGAAYLIWLGIGLIRGAGRTPESGGPAPAVSDRAALRMGFLSNALNPKTTLFVVALFSQVVSPETGLAVQLGYGAFISLAHLGWFALVALALSSEHTAALVARLRQRIEQGIGGALVLLGLGLAGSTLKEGT